MFVLGFLFGAGGFWWFFAELMGDLTSRLSVEYLLSMWIAGHKPQTFSVTFSTGGSGEEGAGLFSLGTRDRTPGNGRKLQLVMSRLDIRIRFFIESVVGHQNMLLREAVPKSRVKALNATIMCYIFRYMKSRELDFFILIDLFQHEIFCELLEEEKICPLM